MVNSNFVINNENISCQINSNVKYCDSSNIAIKRYVKCLIPVVMNNRVYEYLETDIDIDDFIDSENPIGD